MDSKCMIEVICNSRVGGLKSAYETVSIRFVQMLGIFGNPGWNLQIMEFYCIISAYLVGSAFFSEQ